MSLILIVFAGVAVVYALSAAWLYYGFKRKLSM
jgi:hypothetical protein